MLQQTQVKTVLPYFERWLRELPDFAALAAAPEEQVMKLWEGLGYYSRARNLHRLAQAIAALPSPRARRRTGRSCPASARTPPLRSPAFHFGEPAACVDGNVVRILARLADEDRLFRDGSEAAKHFTPLADALIVGSNPGTHNQAMMELGATVCVRQKPMCLVCPVSRLLYRAKKWRTGKISPVSTQANRATHRHSYMVRGTRKLLLKRGHATARRLAGLYELPEAIDLNLKTLDKKTLLVVKRRTITRFQIAESIHVLKPTAALKAAAAAGEGLEWMSLEKLAAITLSGPHKRWIEELRQSQPG